MNTFDFEYQSPLGLSFIVEVDYYYDTPNPLCTDSDWDYQGGFIVEGIRIYAGAEEVFDIDISPSEIVSQFKQYMDEMELKFIMESNESF